MVKIILFILLINTLLFSQEDISHILKVYPKWATNFSKTSINFEELMGGGPPKDGIPALVNPKFETIENANEWLDDKEPIIIVEINNTAKAYPLQILLWHEIANDILSETPIMVTFCPLCYSAITFDRRIDKLTTTFGVSGLLRNSDLVMYDSATESFWQQFTGEAIVGDMLGKELKIIPSQIISYKQFKENFSSGLVLSQNTGYDRAYGNNPYVGYDDIDQSPFLYKGEIDKRLPPNEKVIAVKGTNEFKAYPYAFTKEKRVIADKFEGKNIVVFHSDGAVSVMDDKTISNSKEVGSTGVFESTIDNEILEFTYKERIFIDKKYKSKWNILGKCIEGKFKGRQLNKMNFGDYFAFAWFVFRPETKLYNEREEIPKL